MAKKEIDTWAPLKGKLPSKQELSLWSPEKYMSFFQFCDYFIIDDKLIVTKTSWQKVEEVLAMPDHPFHEFLYRINQFTFDTTATSNKFRFKLMNFMKGILKYLRDNPSVISTRMREMMESTTKFSWALQQTRIVDTAMGFPVVAPDSPIIDWKTSESHSVATIDQQLNDAAVKVTNLLHRLADSITDKEIKALPTKEKLLALGRLAYVFNLSKSLKPNKQVFTQINIHSASRDELEGALLRVNKNE